MHISALAINGTCRTLLDLFPTGVCQCTEPVTWWIWPRGEYQRNTGWRSGWCIQVSVGGLSSFLGGGVNALDVIPGC